MKKIITGVAALSIIFSVSFSEAKNLVNTSGLAPESDSVYSAVVKVNAELDVMYTYINTLFKLQAAAVQPSGNSTYDIWLDTTTSPPVLKYYTGSAWTALNTTQYTSGLSLENSIAATSHNATLVRESASSTRVMVVSSATRPSTIEVAGQLLQNTSTVYLEFAGVAAGIYYVHGERVGQTTAFSLAYDASYSSTVDYLGAVKLSSTGVISFVSSDDVAAVLNKIRPIGLVFAYRVEAMNRAETSYQFSWEYVQSNVDGWLYQNRYTPLKRGWYEFHATQSIAGGLGGCIMINVNAVEIAAACNASPPAKVDAYYYMDGVDDYVEIWSTSQNGSVTYTTSMYSNAFWGRWIGMDF